MAARARAASTNGRGAGIGVLEIFYTERVKVTVMLFASLAEAAGSRKIEIEAGEGIRAGELKALVGAQHPALTRYLPNVLVAVNEEYVDTDAAVLPGATVALIPPVSGGC